MSLLWAKTWKSQQQIRGSMAGLVVEKTPSNHWGWSSLMEKNQNRPTCLAPVITSRRNDYFLILMDILRFSKALFFRMKSLPENGLSHSHNDRHPVRHKALHLRFDETISQRPQGRRAMASWGSKIGHSVVDQNMKYCRLQPVKWSNYQFVKWNYVLYPEGSHCELARVKWPTVTTDHYHQQVRHATFGEATLQYNYIYISIYSSKNIIRSKKSGTCKFPSPVSWGNHLRFSGEETLAFPGAPAAMPGESTSRLVSQWLYSQSMRTS